MSKVFLPPFEELCALLGITEGSLDGEKKVRVEPAVLKKMIQMLVDQIPFDEDSYAETYADIGAALDSGDVTDLKSHYVTSGYFEGRKEYKAMFDEEWYKENYVDVLSAYVEGTIDSCYKHYVDRGIAEWRAPSEEYAPMVKDWQKFLS